MVVRLIGIECISWKLPLWADWMNICVGIYRSTAVKQVLGRPQRVQLSDITRQEKPLNVACRCGLTLIWASFTKYQLIVAYQF